MKKLLITKVLLLSVLTVLISCSGNRVEQGDQIIGLGSPINLQHKSTTIILEDYFMVTEDIDSISVPKELSYLLSEDKKELILNGDLNTPIAVLTIYANDISYDLLVKKSTKQQVTFSLLDQGYRKVQVKGEMNSWDPTSIEFIKNGDRWEATMLLNEGIYQYLYMVDGIEKRDPENDETVSNGMGGFNNLLRVGETEKENPILTTSDYSSSKVVLSSDAPENTIVFWENHRLETEVEGEQIKVNLPGNIKSTERSHIRAWTYNQSGISNDALIPLQNGKVVKTPDQLVRSDARSWNMYFILIDRFKDGNPSNTRKVDDPEIHPKANYYGGDLAGITQSIENGYFKKIGVTALWLSPISQNPETAYGLWDKGGLTTKFSGYHGYWPISSSRVDDRFGSDAELKELLKVAHENGMAIILDYVANHVHEDHPVIKRNPDWATDLYLPDGRMNTELWDEQRLTTWFDTFMPSLDFSRQEVIDVMTDSALFWVKEYELDGFRHDATKHIQLEFWRTLTRKIKEEVIAEEGRSVFQVGETYGSPELIASYINSGMLESQFDFNMFNAASNAFGQNLSFKGLKDQLEQSFKYYGNHNMMGNISGNHDQPRFISLTSGEVSRSEDSKLAGWTREIGIPKPFAYQRLNMLNAFNLTIPGIPVTYTGDEFGSPGAGDPDNRRWMRFDESELSELELSNRNTYSKLSALRNGNMELLYGDFRFHIVEDDILVYSRAYFDQQSVIIFNKSDKEQVVTFDLREGIDFKNLNAHFGTADIKTNNGTLTITLPPETFEILTN